MCSLCRILISRVLNEWLCLLTKVNGKCQWKCDDPRSHHEEVIPAKTTCHSVSYAELEYQK